MASLNTIRFNLLVKAGIKHKLHLCFPGITGIASQGRNSRRGMAGISRVVRETGVKKKFTPGKKKFRPPSRKKFKNF